MPVGVTAYVTDGGPATSWYWWLGRGIFKDDQDDDDYDSTATFWSDTAGEYDVGARAYDSYGGYDDDMAIVYVVKVTDVESNSDFLAVGEQMTFDAVTNPLNCEDEVTVTWDSDGGTPATGSGGSFDNVSWSTTGTKSVTATRGTSSAYKDITVIDWLRGYVKQSVELGDDASINAGIAKLFAEFSENESMPAAAFRIGRKLCLKDHPRAAELVQYIIDKHPDHKAALDARISVGHVHVRRGEDSRAESIYQDVMSYYANDRRLPRAIHLMAEGYWFAAFKQPRSGRELSARAKGCLQKALAKWESSMTQFPDATTTAEAHYFAGECCFKLGQYDKAIEYYQRTADDWPDYRYAWLAQSGVAKAYKFLLMDGAMPRPEAVAAMQTAYEKVLANFPNSPSARSARRWLERYTESNEGGQQ